MNALPKTKSRFSISPTLRASLITGGLMFAGLALATFWVSKEALRIKRARELTALANSQMNGEMVWIPGGKFTMGANDGEADERPLHDVKITGFWMDKTEVTNEQFARFVSATGYKTLAEQRDSVSDGGLAAVSRGSSIFAPAQDQSVWWKPTPEASWRAPEGPGSASSGLEKHPVVHIAWEDALAYARWAGKRLPTEAEWEFAARGGLNHQPFVWGREKVPEGRWMANLWQGLFPAENRAEDGFVRTAPVGRFPANGFGLFDVAGNAAEWCADWYRSDYYTRTRQVDPRGPELGDLSPGAKGGERVVRGGSFLCSDSYRRGYRPSARMHRAPDAPNAEIGLRCARTGKGPG